MAHRIVSQVIITGARVFGRAFGEAYKQAQATGKHNAGKKGGSAFSGGSGITLDDVEHVMERFKKLFDLNDPQKGGSFYLQSKILRARERIEMEVRQTQRKTAQDKELSEGWNPKVYKDR
ncbi:Pam16-domain-containing protein [Penicillium waksmanii]|uniref:Pam16-domain-containing protein n=1 Tax=Penicillium waksmanii TaxID=69791 RepID=UPI002547D262|nr:Pam16-domain-containing protein [Penicillium waksmanii]KAJ5975359.1 Pam16-domain-containing protein [Penicillium waksmanii]